jgi:hypothetical protein
MIVFCQYISRIYIQLLGKIAHNKMYALTALFRRLGVQKPQLAQSAFVRFCSPTVIGLREMLRISYIANQ